MDSITKSIKESVFQLMVRINVVSLIYFYEKINIKESLYKERKKNFYMYVLRLPHFDYLKFTFVRENDLQSQIPMSLNDNLFKLIFVFSI